jgi:hypothetical protein
MHAATFFAREIEDEEGKERGQRREERGDRGKLFSCRLRHSWPVPLVGTSCRLRRRMYVMFSVTFRCADNDDDADVDADDDIVGINPAKS